MQKNLFGEQEEILFPEIVEQPVMWGYFRDLHQADKYKAIVDFDTGKVFSIVSRDYKLIRHEEAIEQIEEAIYKAPELGGYKFTTEFYNDGGHMRRKYDFPGILVDIDKGDKVNLQLHLFNSYDVTWPFIVILGAFRFVCENGLVIGKKFFLLRKRHVYRLEEMNIEKQVSSAIDRFNLQTGQWKEWADQLLTDKAYDQVMNTMKLGKKALKEIKERLTQESDGFGDNGIQIISVWLFFNVLTWYITHRAASLNHRVNMENRLRSAIQGFPAKKG